MEILSHLWMGLQVATEPYNLLAAVRAHPWGDHRGVAGAGWGKRGRLLIPVTFVMPPMAAVILLASFTGGRSTAALSLDPLQHPRRAVGRGGDLRRVSHGEEGSGRQGTVRPFFAHFVGGLFGTILLTFFAPLLAEFPLRLAAGNLRGDGPDVQCVGWPGGKVSGQDAGRHGLGFVMAAVGIDIVSGQLRLTYGLVP